MRLPQVQQRLAAPGQLEQFVDVADDVVALRAVFAGLYGLEDLPPSGGNDAGAAAIAAAKRRPSGFVLKPQREGGGNNLFGNELKRALETWSPHALASHILMEKIEPPSSVNTLVRNGQTVQGLCVVELGVYGVYCSGGSKQLNEPAGHLLRAKLEGVDEGGVAAGFACLCSPLLVDDAVLYPRATATTAAAAAHAAAPVASAMPSSAPECLSPLKRQRSDADPNAV
jgi:glutathione synthase